MAPTLRIFDEPVKFFGSKRVLRSVTDGTTVFVEYWDESTGKFVRGGSFRDISNGMVMSPEELAARGIPTEV